MPIKRLQRVIGKEEHREHVRQLGSFLLIGCLAAAIDAMSYSLLIFGDCDVHIAKGTSALMGASFSYLANRSMTFKALHSFRGMFKFVSLYSASLSANIAVNAATLTGLGVWKYRFPVAFVCATGTSTIMNFIGMKFWVFKRRPI